MNENLFYKVKKILPKKYFFKFLFLLLVLVINSFFEILGLSLLIPIFDIIKSEDNFFINFINKFYIIENLSLDKNKLLILMIFLLIFIFLIKTLINLFSIKYTYLLIANLKTDISCNIFSYYLNQQYLYFKDKNSSEILRNIIIEVGELCERFLLSLTNFLLDIFLIFAILIFLIYQIHTDVYILIIYSLSFTTIFFLLSKKSFFDGGKFRQSLDEKKFSILKNFLNNLVQIKVLNDEEKYLKDFKSFTMEFEKIFAKFTMTTIFTRPIFEFLIIIFLCSLFFYKLLVNFEIVDIIFSLTILTIGCVRILPSLSRIIFNLGQMIFSYPSVNVIYNEISYITKNNSEKFFKKKIIDFNKKIYLDNICFKFPQKNNYVLKNFSLTINTKDKICLIGRSGSGKTTLIEIISGLIKPTSGKIIIDGKDFFSEKEKLDITYIPQETILFDDTIKNNIILDSKFNKEKFEASIKLSKLNDLIDNSHFKENTQVGAFGNKISGGQRQRVAFARCFYNPSNFIILDEPFTALDEKTKNELQENVFSNLRDKTIILITHDLNLMKNFEKIIDLEKIV